MATGIWLVIFGMIFYYLKDIFQKVVLKKSEDQINLEKLINQRTELSTSLNLFKSKQKLEQEKEDLDKEIESLIDKIKENNIR